MPKRYTFPTLFDEVKTVSISKLKEWGYLHPNQWKQGVISWSRNGVTYGKIAIRVDMEETSGYLELDYTSNDEPIKYRVPIVSKPSNLGVGLIWYFVCPVTGKRCKKLYGASKYFLHREAFKGCMYECQTWSKNSRALIETMKWTFAKDNFMEGRWKYMKTHYRGKPTKTYLKYLKLCQKEAQMLRPMRDLLKQVKKS